MANTEKDITRKLTEADYDDLYEIMKEELEQKAGERQIFLCVDRKYVDKSNYWICKESSSFIIIYLENTDIYDEFVKRMRREASTIYMDDNFHYIAKFI